MRLRHEVRRRAWIWKLAGATAGLALAAGSSWAQAPRPVTEAPEPAPAISPQTGLSVAWEELTAQDFVKALGFAKNTCVLPFGVIEKHGPAGPLGVDLIDARHSAITAALREYAIVFPPYYFGQIAEARAQPGTLAYKRSTQLLVLQETVDEMARNGCRKIYIANGHGGNNALVPYFIQTQLDSPRDYVVYTGAPTAAAAPAGPQLTPAQGGPSRPGVDGHAGESEISLVMGARPDLVHTDRSGQQSGARNDRLKVPPGISTSIAWFAAQPNHYQGDSAGATVARGKILMEQRVKGLVEAYKAVKDDQTAAPIQKEFFEKQLNPLKTPN